MLQLDREPDAQVVSALSCTQTRSHPLLDQSANR
jgi:hypothetical protein